ncbi:MAG TPA: alanine racemase [Bryobacteraceae bacterium]|nr:alanine racemase [Bryobacteraceae bacterium]
MLTKNQIPTPALLLDSDLLEANLSRMAQAVKKSGKQLRPHAKAHKCVEIAKRQITHGACGISVATVAEAELMAANGIPGILLTSPLGDPAKIARIAATGAMAVVDHVRQVEWYEAAARPIDLLIDLDIGDHRTGASSPEQALGIARAIAKSPRLRLRGLQAYSVSGSHGADLAIRKQISESAFQTAAEIRDLLAGEGWPTEILTGGSTGSWDVDLDLPDVTELQCGSYVMMDLAYRRIGIDFAHAMTILATVVSANHDAFVTVDAGVKAFATDRPFGPEPVNCDAKYRWGGDEFGYLDNLLETKLALGDRVEFIAPHCDPTVNLYDRIYVCRGETVEAIWPVMGRC